MLLLFLTPPLAIGVVLRLVGYRFFDLTLEGSFLMGLIGGRVVGLLGGSLISLASVWQSRMAFQSDGRAGGPDRGNGA